METLEVHSKDFLVKWIHAPDNSVIDWQAKPLKKSINFAIYKKNEDARPRLENGDKVHKLAEATIRHGAEAESVAGPPSGPLAGPLAGVAAVTIAASANGVVPQTAQSPTGRLRSDSASSASRLRSGSKATVNELSDSASSIYKTLSRSNTRSSSFNSNLTDSQLTLLKDYKKLVSGELVHGKFEVAQGGTYAFIFDNSFSKTIGKKILFSTKILTADSLALVRGLDDDTSMASAAASAVASAAAFVTAPITAFANTSASPHLAKLASSASITRVPPVNGKSSALSSSKDLGNMVRSKNGELLQGVLTKRRRRKLQGFTKRLFVLNHKYGTLSYFRINDNKLRGQMPIKHSIISANSKNREIIIDSGMEVWDLKASDLEVFRLWIDAFNQVKRSSSSSLSAATSSNRTPAAWQLATTAQYVMRELNHISLKLLALQLETPLPNAHCINDDVARLIEYLQNAARDDRLSPSEDVTSTISQSDFYDAREYLDSLSQGVVLLNEPHPPAGAKTARAPSKTRQSLNDDDDDVIVVDDASLTSSSEELQVDMSIVRMDIETDKDSLYPLPWKTAVERDCEITICNHSPPSILGFLRKNIGKDLSQIAMPVTMNEPLSTCQKYTELLEYCQLIDNALQANCEGATGERILRIAAFAVSSFSSMRSRDRNARKPFTPLLGETFELVREDFGVRLIVEKVSHRPPVYAMFVESKDWEFSYCPSPEQKFWGKNAEIITRGVASLTIKTTGEVFQWSLPLSLVKNIIAGEKYTEPANTLTVKSSFGYKAVAEFAKAGMFSGRLEDLTIKAYNLQDKKQLPYEVTGKWTESLTLKTNTTERQIWTVGELLPDSSKKYGFTKFAGTLNKTTEIEADKLPITDSRLRPDLITYQKGNVEDAEILKVDLEEKQRVRRKLYEVSGETYVPSFFRQVSPDSDFEWAFIKGKRSYWNRRKVGDWDGVPQLW